MNHAQILEMIAERASTDAEFARLVERRADWQIAEALSAGRTRLQSRQIGSGTILSTLQGRPGANLLRAMRRLAADDALIDEGIRLLDAGKWDVGAAESQKALDEFAAAGLMTQEACAALKALGTAPDAISTDEVSDALNGRA